ncbi:MAG: response regulator [Chitinophagaceae bacterium]|nr:MAG: response regulator [Chitinophagaceae bacterium]
MKVQTAMVIDDDHDLTSILSSILEARKIYTVALHTLAEAAECLTHLKPTVVFLDNSFPEGLGVNFIKSIKSIDNEIKIVMITADDDQWVEDLAKREKINFFIKKPFNLKIINSVLDKLNMRKG